MYIYNTILFSILPLNPITKKINKKTKVLMKSKKSIFFFLAFSSFNMLVLLTVIYKTMTEFEFRRYKQSKLVSQ